MINLLGFVILMGLVAGSLLFFVGAVIGLCSH